MLWTPRIKPYRIRQLYQRTRIGILDEDKLQHIGCGLYARSEAILSFGKAIGGEVPCPECGHTVYRQKYYRNTPSASPFEFPCPTCSETITFQNCRDALRNHPKCFDCNVALDWQYAQNVLTCPNCTRTWTWQQYRQSIKYRTLLPCPHCNQSIRRPKNKNTQLATNQKADWDLTCPHCKQQGQHIKSQFVCPHCHYQKPWHTFTQRLKRRVERLHCTHCDHTFTWQSWKRHHQNPFAQTGNPEPIHRFIAQWPQSQTLGEQLIVIDRLIHALHGRGALAPVFIDGNQETVLKFLDDLAFT
jgi:predicted RNA-binding Zn-ribbon protein involved in translation (DUF1610 family)